MVRLLIFAFLFCLYIPSGYGQGMQFNDEHKHPIEPAFEKIYVTHEQLVTFPDGIYYFDDEGKTVKVRGLLSDIDGMYIITIKHQCPLCGRCWTGTEPDDDYDCPIFKRRYHPKVWGD